MINKHKNKNSVKNIKVLYVEDDQSIAEEVMEILELHLNNVYYASNGQEGLKLFEKYGIDLVISDIKMPVMDGLTMAQEIKKIDNSAVIIITSAFSEVKYFQKAIEIGVDNYLLKPIDAEKLLQVIYKSASSLLQRKQLNEYVIFSEMVMDSTSNFIVLVSDGEIEFKNKSLLSKFNIDDVNFESFCVSEYILNKDGSKRFKDKEGMLLFFKNNTEAHTIVYMYSDLNDSDMPLNAYLVTDTYFENADKHLIIFTDVTQINEEKEKYALDSITDKLTNLNNKFYFNKILSQMLNEAKSDLRYKLSLIIFDIDFFKKVNDTYGHQVGDDVLQELSEIIKNTLRVDDIVARWGGEEFVILSSMDSTAAMMLAQKLRKQIEVHDFKVINKMTCSFGVSQFNKGDNEKSLLGRADEALYIAKANGRNVVEFK